MKMRIACGLAVCLAGSLLTGCTANQGIVRAQSPNQPQVAGQRVVEPTGFRGIHGSREDRRFREDPGACQGPDCPYLHNGRQQFASFGHGHQGHGGSCPTCQNGHDDGQTWHPTHRHWFKYRQPRDLVYPPANTPAAIVQYPYYNVKGPSDFFMK